MVPAWKRLQRYESRDVFEAEADRGGGRDLRRARHVLDPLPVLTRAVEPVGDPDRAAGIAGVLDRGELGDASTRRGQAGPRSRRGATRPPAVAEVDWELAADEGGARR